MEKIRDSVISVLPNQHARAKLVDLWGKLRYPKYQIDEMMTADEQILNGIFISLLNVGLFVLIQEKELFKSTSDLTKKRDILIGILSRLADDANNLFAIEFAINESIPQNIPIENDENMDDAMDEIERIPILQRQLGHTFSNDMIRRGDEFEFENESFEFFNTYHLIEPIENLLNYLDPYDETLRDFHLNNEELSGKDLMRIYNRLVPIVEAERNVQKLTALNSLYNFLQRLIVEEVDLNMP